MYEKSAERNARINIVEQKKREKEKYTLQWFLLDFHANK